MVSVSAGFGSRTTILVRSSEVRPATCNGPAAAALRTGRRDRLAEPLLGLRKGRQSLRPWTSEPTF